MTEIIEDFTNEELQRRVLNLSRMVEINSIINSTLDIRKLLTIIMENIKAIMRAEASTLLLFEEESNDLVFKVALGGAGDTLTEKYRVKIGQGIAGWVARERRPLVINDVYNDERFDPNFDMSTGFKTTAMLCSPLMFKGKLLGVIQAINPLDRAEFTEEDSELFKIFSEQAALAVQNAIFFGNVIEEERIKGELSSARSIQELLVPDFSVTVNNFEISALLLPAREVGGTFHGLYRFEEDRMGCALGDIHEKGIPGGLGASSISGAIMALSAVKGNDPAALMRSVQRVALDRIDFIKAMTLFYGVADTRRQELIFSNAGVAYPLLIREGAVSYLRIGIQKVDDVSREVKRVRVRLRKGDMFAVVTDGILNIKNRNGHVLGLKRIMERLEEPFGSADEAVKALVAFSEEFSGGLERRDDMGIMIIKVS